MKHICFIPARQGSKRFPNKNREQLCGKSLLEIAITTARDSCMFNEIIISTDDEVLIQSVRDEDVTILKRSKELSGDNIGLVDVVRAFIKQRTLSIEDTICLMPVTNPLKLHTDIINAYSIYQEQDAQHGVISLQEVEYPVNMMFQVNNNLTQNYLGLDWNKMQSTRKQDFNHAYMWNDAFVIDSVLRWSDTNRKIFTDDMLPYIMPNERSITIDYPHHMEIAKLFYKC